MKYKNYKSAVHNFVHSFQSRDYMKSPKQSYNVLISLYEKGLPPKATFDFINGTIEPKEAVSESSSQLLNDYMQWLPEHCLNHNCDPSLIVSLKTSIWVDFEKAWDRRSKNDINLEIQTKTEWKAQDKSAQIVETKEVEIISQKNFLKPMSEF